MEPFFGVGIMLLYVSIVIAIVLWVLSWNGWKKFTAWGRAGIVLTVLLIAYAIPFGDHTIGLIKFRKICGERAGIHVYRTVENVDGFAWNTGRQVKPYTTHGFPFYEVVYRKREIYRYVLLK